MRFRVHNADDLCHDLAAFLQEEGTHMPDRLEILRQSNAYAKVKLNDYWNGFHKAWDKRRHYSDLTSFYREGNDPILGISTRTRGGTIFICRPADIAAQGLGYVIRNKLPEELKESNDMLAIHDTWVTNNPRTQPLLLELVGVIGES